MILPLWQADLYWLERRSGESGYCLRGETVVVKYAGVGVDLRNTNRDVPALCHGGRINADILTQ